MPEETPPRCEICGAPYLEIGEEVRRFLPEALREQIRFRPSCDCLERKKQEEVLEEIARKQREARQQEIEELFQRARLSKRFRRCTLQSFVPMDQKQEQALSVFSEFAERFSEFKEREINGLYLFGLPARGKTHLAAALVNELVPRGVCCIYQKSTQLLAKFFEAVYDKKPQSVLLRPLSEAELLVLDDLGKGEARGGSNPPQFIEEIHGLPLLPVILFYLIRGRLTAVKTSEQYYMNKKNISTNLALHRILYIVRMKKNNIIHARTCVYNVNYHVVWSTKYRKEILDEFVP